MGVQRNHAIIITYWQKKSVEEAHQKAIEIFDKSFENDPSGKGSSLISPILSGIVNEEYSFFICPDGSKEGWETSDNGDHARKEFLDWLAADSDNFCEYVEIAYGGDARDTVIIRDKPMDLDYEES